MDEKFEARYQAQDGYAGGDRPIHFKIDALDLEEGMDDEALREFYFDSVQGHFEQRVTPGPERVDEFVAWAKEQLSKRGLEAT